MACIFCVISIEMKVKEKKQKKYRHVKNYTNIAGTASYIKGKSHNELLKVVIPYIESHYSVIADADHRGIYGYSMGGGVAFAEGIGNLDVFHHVCPTSALPINHPSDRDMFPYGGAEAKQKLKTLMLSCGTADWCGFYPSNLGTHNYCEANGIPHAWLSVEGGNHDGGVWSPAMWNFLQLAFPADGVKPEISNNLPESTLPGETKTLPDGWYTLKNVNAEKYLQVKDAAGKSGQNVELGTRNGADNQKWYLKNQENGYITFTSALGEFMLDVNGGSSENDANIQIYNGHSGTAQQFQVTVSEDNQSYIIATKSSGCTKAVDVWRALKNDGTNVCQYAYNGNANQQWVFFSPLEVLKFTFANFMAP
ncbi:RICIN domain-containing protein [[Clostridium] polysaccharolyticum]|nr:RICIN domain-containing protein [[Clostridium] polysaccharolyticum]